MCTWVTVGTRACTHGDSVYIGSMLDGLRPMAYIGEWYEGTIGRLDYVW